MKPRPACPACKSEFLIFSDDWNFRCISCGKAFQIISKFAAEGINGAAAEIRIIIPRCTCNRIYGQAANCPVHTVGAR